MVAVTCIINPEGNGIDVEEEAVAVELSLLDAELVIVEAAEVVLDEDN